MKKKLTPKQEIIASLERSIKNAQKAIDFQREIYLGHFKKKTHTIGLLKMQIASLKKK